MGEAKDDQVLPVLIDRSFISISHSDDHPLPKLESFIQLSGRLRL